MQFKDDVRKTDYKFLQNVLKEYVRTVNTTWKMTVAEWTRYKYSLIKFEQKTGLVIFRYDIDDDNNNNESWPQFSLDIDFDVLEKTPTWYYLVILAMENEWFGKYFIAWKLPSKLND